MPVDAEEDIRDWEEALLLLWLYCGGDSRSVDTRFCISLVASLAVPAEAGTCGALVRAFLTCNGVEVVKVGSGFHAGFEGLVVLLAGGAPWPSLSRSLEEESAVEVDAEEDIAF